MTNSHDTIGAKKNGWLLFFYSVPTKPTSSRIKVWRRLIKAGAVQLKGAVYALPNSEEHYELYQWLVSEVEAMRGEAGFVVTDRIETMTDEQLATIFDSQRAEQYRGLDKGLDELEMRINTVTKASGTITDGLLNEQLVRHRRAFDELRRTDFFGSDAGEKIEKRINALAGEIINLSGPGPKVDNSPKVILRRLDDYQGRLWLTRTRPFIDRMASAWLIKKFIDKAASFGFIEEAEIDQLDKNAVSFDIRGGEFTHVGELCTFEVLIKSFALRNKPLRKMAEIVHELDVKDGRYNNPEASGIEEILAGIRKTAKTDAEALEKGIGVFDMVYSSRS